MPRERGATWGENGTRQRVDGVDDTDVVDGVDSMDGAIFEVVIYRRANMPQLL